MAEPNPRFTYRSLQMVKRLDDDIECGPCLEDLVPFLRAFSFLSTHKSNQRRPLYAHGGGCLCRHRVCRHHHSGTWLPGSSIILKWISAMLASPGWSILLCGPKKVNTHSISGPGVQFNVQHLPRMRKTLKLRYSL